MTVEPDVAIDLAFVAESTNEPILPTTRSPATRLRADEPAHTGMQLQHAPESARDNPEMPNEPTALICPHHNPELPNEPTALTSRHDNPEMPNEPTALTSRHDNPEMPNEPTALISRAPQPRIAERTHGPYQSAHNNPELPNEPTALIVPHRRLRIAERTHGPHQPERSPGIASACPGYLGEVTEHASPRLGDLRRYRLTVYDRAQWMDMESR